ncbi:MAG TPA: MerR family transcriptional regulator [Cytophagaceae bacterium]|jgi:DNA-binding transcriptional MerR regulator|nr:MerR family transcriptional regulator [Cytophagaceae bacterium]
MDQEFKLDHFWGAESLQKTSELYSFLTESVFTIKDLGINKRVVMHWDNSGLVVIKRESKENWRRFNFIDYVWLHIIHDLREIGFPIPLILKAKEDLLTPISLQWLIDFLKLRPELIDPLSKDDSLNDLKSIIKSEETENENIYINTLILLIVETISKRKPVSIIIFHDGVAIPFLGNSLENYTDEINYKMTYETYIVISVSNIIKRFLLDPNSTFAISKLNILEENEKHLLEIVNSGKYVSVTIHFKNQKMKSLELVKDQDIKRKIVDVISDGSYQDIVIKTHKGMVTKIQNTIKVILD